MKKIFLFIVFLVFSFWIVYATVTIARDRKVQDLPWQWTPSFYYDSAHNVWESWTPENRFSSLNNTIKDKVTNLVWEANPSVSSMNWESAKQYCNWLSIDWDWWRLPTKKELFSIIDYSKHNSSIDLNYFSITTNGLSHNWNSFWSSTSYATDDINYKNHAWLINFANWDDIWLPKTDSHKVICVR